MALVMMDGYDKNPIFHDFLGMSYSADRSPNSNPKRTCEGDFTDIEASVGLVSGSSGLGSERQGLNNSEVFHFHDRMNTNSEPETSNTVSGRKRSSSSSYMNLVGNRMLSVGSDSLEGSRQKKAFVKEVLGERTGRSNDDDMLYSMQPPSRPTSSLLLHTTVSSKPDSLISKWERALPMNVGHVGNCSSRSGQSGAQMEKLSSLYTFRDSNIGAALIIPAAADEGSRTGIKGSGALSIVSPSISKAVERNPAGTMPYSGKCKTLQISVPDSSNTPSHHKLGISSRQMTIFYAGQAHVFDDVHPNKAEIIMALAGSNGGSWSTTYFPTTGENEMRIGNLPAIPDRGLVSHVSRIPLTSDLQTLLPGGHQSSRGGRDLRLTALIAEPKTDGKRDV